MSDDTHDDVVAEIRYCHRWGNAEWDYIVKHDRLAAYIERQHKVATILAGSAVRLEPHAITMQARGYPLPDAPPNPERVAEVLEWANQQAREAENE
jgi:hypothetical protein